MKKTLVVSLLLLFLAGAAGVLLILALVPAGVAYWITHRHLVALLSQAGLGDQSGGIVSWLVFFVVASGIYKAALKRKARWPVILGIASAVGGAHFAVHWTNRHDILGRPLYATFDLNGEVALTRDPVSRVTGRTNVQLIARNAAFIHRSLSRPMRAVDPVFSPWFDGGGTPIVFLSRTDGPDGRAVWEGFDRFGYHPVTGELLVPATPGMRAVFDREIAALRDAAAADAQEVELLRRESVQSQQRLREEIQKSGELKAQVQREAVRQTQDRRATEAVIEQVTSQLDHLRAELEESRGRAEIEQQRLKEERQVRMAQERQRSGIGILLPVPARARDGQERLIPTESSFRLGPFHFVGQRDAEGRRRAGIKLRLHDWGWAAATPTPF